MSQTSRERAKKNGETVKLWIWNSESLLTQTLGANATEIWKISKQLELRDGLAELFCDFRNSYKNGIENWRYEWIGDHSGSRCWFIDVANRRKAYKCDQRKSEKGNNYETENGKNQTNIFSSISNSVPIPSTAKPKSKNETQKKKEEITLQKRSRASRRRRMALYIFFFHSCCKHTKWKKPNERRRGKEEKKQRAYPYWRNRRRQRQRQTATAHTHTPTISRKEFFFSLPHENTAPHETLNPIYIQMPYIFCNYTFDCSASALYGMVRLYAGCWLLVLAFFVLCECTKV